MLARRVTADRTDPFATDPNETIRTLGRLALRRDVYDPTDLFVLGDLCARLALADEQLMILYVGKTLLAYRRARQYANRAQDRKLAEQAVEIFVRWVMEIADRAPTARNLAAALWAASEIPKDDQPGDFHNILIRLAGRYPDAGDTLPPLPALPEPRETIELTAVPTPTQPMQIPLTEEIIEELPAELLDTQPDLLDTQADDDRRIELGNMLGSLPPNIPRKDSAGNHDWTGPSALPTAPPDAVLPAVSAPIILPAPRPADEVYSDDFRVDDVLANRYEVKHILRGGMGVIYLCYDYEQRDIVAIKTFQGRFLTNERAVGRFTQEALTWIRLEKHTNIVQARLVKEIGSERVRERPHIILEYIAGPEGLGSDLKSWIVHNRLDLITAVDVALQIGLGMQHAVRMVPGLVHRDLKPANILVRHDGIAKVTDFGLVQSFDNVTLRESPDGEPPDSLRLTRAGAIVGTAPYLSPEQARGADVDLRSDIYTFGAILYEMLFRRPLFGARTFEQWILAHINQTPELPADTPATIPYNLTALLMACLEKDPANRPADWGALVNELSGVYEWLTGKPASYEVSGPQMQARELMDQAYSLTELGYCEEALTAHDRSIDLDPESAWIWTSKGRTLRLLNRYDEALACYDRALYLNPEFAWAWKSKGIILERLDKFDDALHAYETAARLRPNDIWALYYQAGVLRDLNRHDEAIERLDHALAIDSKHALSHTRRGQLLRALQHYPEALAAFEQAIELDPSDGAAWDGKGLTLKQMGQTSEAISAFMQATRLSSWFWVWEHLADALIDQGGYLEALPVIQQAIRLNGQQASLWAEQGRILRQLQRYPEALDSYNQALELEPGNTRILSGKGWVLERLGRTEEALAQYRAAAQSEPGNAWNWYNLGCALISLGRYEDAIPGLRNAVLIDPQHAGSWANWGSALRRLGNYKKALTCLKRAVRLDPRYAWAWNEQGLTLESLNRSDDALKAYESAASAAPREPSYCYNQADLLIALSRYEAALPALQQVLDIAPNHHRAWAKLGQAQRRLNHLDEALVAYQRATEIDPHYAWAWNGQGLTLSSLDRHDDALICFRRATEEDPTDVWYWYNQADELLTLDRYEAALDALDQSLQLDETHMESWAKRGQVLRRLGRYKEAVASYDHALALDPHYAWAWNGRGLALEQMNHREEAIVSYEKAAQEDPTSVWYWLNQLDPLLSLGRREEALDVCDQAIKTAPEEPIPWARKGQILRRLGRHEEALDAYDQAVQLDPHYAWAWNGKGLAYAELLRWEEALTCYERAVQENDGDVWFWHNRGEALMALNQYDEAIRMFNRALEIDPQHDSSRKKRTEARKKRHDLSEE